MKTSTHYRTWFQARRSLRPYFTLSFNEISFLGQSCPRTLHQGQIRKTDSFRTLPTPENSVFCCLETFPVTSQTKALNNPDYYSNRKTSDKGTSDGISSQRNRIYLASGVCQPDLVGWELSKEKGSLERLTLLVSRHAIPCVFLEPLDLLPTCPDYRSPVRCYGPGLKRAAQSK